MPPRVRKSISTKTQRPISEIVRRLTLKHLAPQAVQPPERRLRKHPERQRVAVRASIVQRGFVLPILVDRHGIIVDGVLRHQIASELGLAAIPVIEADDLNRNERRLLSIALNKLPELAVWDEEALVLELGELLSIVDLDFTVEAVGLSTAELDVLFEAQDDAGGDNEEDHLEAAGLEDPVVTRLGDLWLIGRLHRLYCGNAREAGSYRILLANELARMVCTDPPFNVRIAKNVSGLGKKQHREFVEASGEMSPEEFTNFLTDTFRAIRGVCCDGAVIFAAMDWRHMAEMLGAGANAELSLINLCVWQKTNAGMGSLYRSQHELFFVWKYGQHSHINNVQLGAGGRYRTNVWSVAGQNSFGAHRDEELALHPTVKPVSLVSEAIRDVSNFGEIVLDPFCGSGTSLIAAEKTGRRAYTMELDPAYVDVALRRFMAFRPDVRVTLAETGESFAEVERRRSAMGDFDEDLPPDAMWEIL